MVGLTGACANQSAPPGGPEDRRPPIVVRTEPDTFGEMLERDGRVRFHFDERISENVGDGDLASAVTVSPLTSEVRVSHGRSSLTVTLEEGFRPGLVYRVTLLAVVSDLFGNRMAEPFEIVFSTGGEPTPTATLAGEVWDRITGRGVDGATVQAVGADSLVHVARADNQGIFALRYLPTGDFAVTGFQDNDRNRELGPREARGSQPASLAEGDTLLVTIPLLAPDTTPAVPGRADALDSVTIVVQFDDFLDPDASADQVGVRLTREGGTAPAVTRLFHERAYDEYVDEIVDSLARLDSLDAAARAETAAAVVVDSLADTAAVAADSAQADTVAVEPPVDTVAPRPVPPRLEGGPSGPAAPPGRSLPGRRLVGLLDGPLEPGAYQLSVESVVNINGLPDGGGEVTLTYEPPPPPQDSIPQDGDDPPADSGAVADTVGVTP